MRLDAYLAKEFPHHSRSTWAKLIQRGDVLVNGKVTTSVSATVTDADVVTVKDTPEPQRDLDLPIIYEDENVIVINKPAGVLTHSKGALNDEPTVADFIRSRGQKSGVIPSNVEGSSNCHPELVSEPVLNSIQESSLSKENQVDSRVSEPLVLVLDTRDENDNIESARDDESDTNRFGIVHRLDRATSGVLIGAKNETARKFLQKQFADRKAKKTYLAVVEGTPSVIASTAKQSSAAKKSPGSPRRARDDSPDEFRIDLPIARNPKKPATFRVDPKGKPAVTDVRLIQILPNGNAVLELKPLTGRTHQLRVHLAYIGAPIVGDPIYNSSSSGPTRGSSQDCHPELVSEPVLNSIQESSLSREDQVDSRVKHENDGTKMFLHAKSLEITLPGGKRLTFEAPPPDYFQTMIKESSAK